MDANRPLPRLAGLDIPDEVRNKVIADGNGAWLDELPSVVETLARESSPTIGATLRSVSRVPPTNVREGGEIDDVHRADRRRR